MTPHHVNLVLFPRLPHVKTVQETTAPVVFEQRVREVVRVERAFPDVMEEVLHCQPSGEFINEGDGDRVNAVKDVIGIGFRGFFFSFLFFPFFSFLLLLLFRGNDITA